MFHPAAYMQKCFLVDGAWSMWGSWSSCKNGKKKRTRECNNPAPLNNGASCPGSSSEEESCPGKGLFKIKNIKSILEGIITLYFV